MTIPALDLPDVLHDRSGFERSINRLVGLLDGIAVDGQIGPSELALLRDWLDQHAAHGRHPPYADIVPVIEHALADGTLTEAERLDLLWLCEQVSSQEYFDLVGAGVQRLQAQLAAVSADGVVTDAELDGLRRWLADHRHLRGCWPYDEIASLVDEVLADGRVDDTERATLQSAFAAWASDGGDAAPDEPLPTLAGLCAVDPTIVFVGRRFRLTGHPRQLDAASFARIVPSHGGLVQAHVDPDTDVLVVGADTSPAWRYSRCGREIDLAVEQRRQGGTLQIVHEDDFLRAAAGG